MTWPRVARVVVAVIGLGCAVAIAVYTRSRPEPAPPSQTIADPTATAVEVDVMQQYLRSAGPPIKVACATALAYPDGRGRCEKARVEGLEETRFTITADLLETRSKPGITGAPDRYDLSGSPLVLTTDDGLRLESATATYDAATRHLTIPGPVTFVKGRCPAMASARPTIANWTRSPCSIKPPRAWNRTRRARAPPMPPPGK